jgi:hypothetical protein
MLEKMENLDQDPSFNREFEKKVMMKPMIEFNKRKSMTSMNEHQ